MEMMAMAKDSCTALASNFHDDCCHAQTKTQQSGKSLDALSLLRHQEATQGARAFDALGGWQQHCALESVV
jgi:hypothetical protein